MVKSLHVQRTSDTHRLPFTIYHFTFHISGPFRVANALSGLFREGDAAIVIYY